MKKIIISLFVFSLVFGTVGTVFAHDGENRDSSSGNNLFIKANADIKLRGNGSVDDNGKDRDANGIKLRGDGSVDDNNKNKGDDTRDFTVNFSARFEHVIAKLTAIHDRFIKLTERIESRIKKMDADNIDTDASVEFVAKAREELRLASIATSEAEAAFKVESQSKAIVNADNYKSVYAKTLANIKTAKGHLIQAHKNLVQAISSLKPGLNKEIKANGSVQVR